MAVIPVHAVDDLDAAGVEGHPVEHLRQRLTALLDRAGLPRFEDGVAEHVGLHHVGGRQFAAHR